MITFILYLQFGNDLLINAFPILGLGVRCRTEHEGCILVDLRARPLILQEVTSQGHVAHLGNEFSNLGPCYN